MRVSVFARQRKLVFEYSHRVCERDTVLFEVRCGFTGIPFVLHNGQCMDKCLPTQGGKVKALAVTGKTRSRLLPNVPTYTETGEVRGFEATENWYGIVAPAGLSKDIVRRLHDDVVNAINAPDVQRLMADQGYVTAAGSPEQFANTIASDLSKWSKLLKTLDTR